MVGLHSVERALWVFFHTSLESKTGSGFEGTRLQVHSTWWDSLRKDSRSTKIVPVPFKIASIFHLAPQVVRERVTPEHTTVCMPSFALFDRWSVPSSQDMGLLHLR